MAATFIQTESAPLDETVLASLRDLQNASDPDFLRELVALYLAEAPGQIGELHAATDLEGLRHAVHRLKGSSASIGAAPLAALCSRLDGYCRTGDLPRAQALVPLINDEFERAAAALRAL